MRPLSREAIAVAGAQNFFQPGVLAEMVLEVSGRLYGSLLAHAAVLRNADRSFILDVPIDRAIAFPDGQWETVARPCPVCTVDGCGHLGVSGAP